MFFTDEVGLIFEPFGWLHISLFIIVITGVLLIVYFRKVLRNHPKERTIAIVIASFAFVWEIGLYAWKIGNGLWSWDDGLPLGLCGLTLYVAIFAMYFKKFSLFEIGYYWTWGAIASVLFPDILYSIDRFRFYQFMFGHMFFFFMFVYMIAVYQWYPTWKSWRKSVLTLSLITVILTITSFITDTNLMFMRESEGTPLELFEGGPYIFYFIGVVGLAFIIMTVWQLPWHFYHKRTKS